MDTIIKGATVVFPYFGERKVDIGIDAGKIAAIGEDLVDPAAETIDARGMHVFPGAIDGHSHYGVYGGKPGAESDYRLSSRASAVGGITTIINFKRLNGTYMEALPEEIAVGERESVVDFTYHLGVMTGLHVDEMKDYVEKLGITSFKLFLGYRGLERTRFGTDRTLDDEFLLDIYERMAEISPDLRLCIHCENVEMGKHFKKKYDSVPDRNKLVYYDLYNPDIVEAENVLRTGYLASRYGVKTTVVHTSAAASVEALESVKWFDPEMQRIETCPHYLLETVDNAKGLGGVVKPPLRYAKDNDGLWEGIRKGIVTIMGTDHVSIFWADKFKNGYDIDKCQLGFGGQEFMFPLVLSEGYYNRGIKLQTIAEITAANTAKAYGLYPRKGGIEVGGDADLLIVDLQKEQTITPTLVPMNSDFSIFEGRKVKGWPVLTLRRGEVLARDGKVVEPKGKGVFLKRSAAVR